MSRLRSLFSRFWLPKAKAGEKGHGWCAGTHTEIVRLWHNPETIPFPTRWRRPAEFLRSHAQNRAVSATINELPFSGPELTTATFGGSSFRFLVSAALESLSNGGLLKHAMIPIPGGHMEKGMAEVFQKIALAIEPHEPAFQYGFGHPQGAVWHLLWPMNWERAALDLSFPGPVPMWPSQVQISRSGKGFGIDCRQSFNDQVVALGLDSWKKALMGNLIIVVAALAFLDLQRSRDLMALQRTDLDVYSKRLGSAFVDVLSVLIEHRLGNCPVCQHVVCPSLRDTPGISDTGSMTASEAAQTNGVAVYPIGTGCYYGRFYYTCSRCSERFARSAFLSITDPAPAHPDLGGFMCPFCEVAIKTERE